MQLAAKNRRKPHKTAANGTNNGTTSRRRIIPDQTATDGTSSGSVCADDASKEPLTPRSLLDTSRHADLAGKHNGVSDTLPDYTKRRRRCKRRLDGLRTLKEKRSNSRGVLFDIRSSVSNDSKPWKSETVSKKKERSR